MYAWRIFPLSTTLFSALNTLKAIEFHLVRQMEWTPSVGEHIGFCVNVEKHVPNSISRQQVKQPNLSSNTVAVLKANI